MTKSHGGHHRRRSGIGVRRSPTKGRSPFKRRSISLTAPSSSASDAAIAANIRVAVRVRPENEREIAGGYRNVIDVVDDRLLVFDPKEVRDDFFFHGRRQDRRDINKKVNKDHKFAFDAVFGPGSTNEDVFDGTTKDLVDVVFNGYNCSVFVYGATGAGKTHTMVGNGGNPGIIFLTVMELYKRIGEGKDETDCEVVVSYLEIYNEMVIDLINPGTQLQVREDGKMGVNIPNLSRHRPNGPEDLLRLLQFGNGNRTQHPTDANKESSRSHAVFQVYIKQTAKSSGLSADVKVAKLAMIDLAGSERGSATSSRGAARFREGANINKSLLALGNCINALAEGSKYIPYRNSKLTRLLKDSIGGNCKTVMISNVTPSSLSFEDTYNTLKYADRAKKIKIKLKKNVVSVDFHVAQYAKIVEDLKQEIADLKQKMTATEEENAALKVQLNDVIVNNSESNLLEDEAMQQMQKRLAELEARQADYDDLQERIKRSEEAMIASSEATSKVVEKEELSQEWVDKMNSYKELLRKRGGTRSTLKLIQVRREFHNRKLDRSLAIIPDTSYGINDSDKIQKVIGNLDGKIVRLARKEKHMKTTLDEARDVLESTLPMDHQSDFWREAADISKEIKANHVAKLTQLMYEEQNRTEDLLKDSLRQLKGFYLLMSGKVSGESTDQFNDLIARIQCTKVQYRDNNIVETNEDTQNDRLGAFFGHVVDLSTAEDEHLDDPAEAAEERPMDETVVVDRPDDELIVVVQDDVDDAEDEEEMKKSPEKWRPPTPPKLPQCLPAHTPTPPQLSTVSRVLDTTYDHQERKEEEIMNDTVVLDTRPEYFMETTVEPSSQNDTVVLETQPESSMETTVEPSSQNDTVVLETQPEYFMETTVKPSSQNDTVVLETQSEYLPNLGVVEPRPESGSPSSLDNSPVNNANERRGTYTVNPKVAKVSPMVTESQRYRTGGAPLALRSPSQLPSSVQSAHVHDRRKVTTKTNKNGLKKNYIQASQSTSSLLRALGDVKHVHHPPRSDVPDANAESMPVSSSSDPALSSAPNYMQATTASSRKFRGTLPSISIPTAHIVSNNAPAVRPRAKSPINHLTSRSRSPDENTAMLPPHATLKTMKINALKMKKSKSSSTLKQINK